MPETRLGGAFKLIMLFALEVGLVVALHWLGSIDKMAIDFSNFKQWIDTTSPEIALVASIRILALGFAYWVLGTSFLYMAARAFHIPFLIRALELTTVPGVRRVIDAGLAAAIIGGTVFGGAGAVFAKSQSAQTNAAYAPIVAAYKDARPLYTPTPAGDAIGGPVVGMTTTDSPSVQVDQPVRVSSNEKVAVVSNDAPSSASAADSDPTTPARDNEGKFIPTPAGGPSTPVEETVVDDTKTTQPSKVAIGPTPADETTTTTSPKVTVPTTEKPPEVTNPSVAVDGKVVQRPNDNPDPDVSLSSSYTVVSGDNFWAIAKTQVENNLGREATNTDVADYWVKLIEANKSTIRSGDPDLIFPGEVFTLPPL